MRNFIWNPNINSGKSKVYSLFHRFFFVKGYQRFFYNVYTQNPIPLNQMLCIKSEILRNFFLHNIFQYKISSMVDIGCSNGFFLLLARYYGLDYLTGIDIDSQFKKTFTSKRIYGNINFSNSGLEDIKEKFDLVLALSLIHWLIGQKSEKHNNKEEMLGCIFGHISNITNKVAIVELVTTNDIKVKTYKHYCFDIYEDEFEKEAEKFFNKTEIIGYTTQNRIIYALWK